MQYVKTTNNTIIYISSREGNMSCKRYYSKIIEKINNCLNNNPAEIMINLILIFKAKAKPRGMQRETITDSDF